MTEAMAQGRRAGLLTMATGTGKTRMSIALVELLMRTNWVKRVLFLADRVALVKQAANAFKEHLPDSSPVNLVTDKNTEGRVFVSTYPTMMGLIEDGRRELAQGMLDNFAAQIGRYGHVPNGTRTYYLSRSQPPVFALMVQLCEARGGPPAVHYLGKAATFCLLYAFPLLLIGAYHGPVPDFARPIAWAFTIWGTGLYLWAGAVYLVQYRQLMRAPRQ